MYFNQFRFFCKPGLYQLIQVFLQRLYRNGDLLTTDIDCFDQPQFHIELFQPGVVSHFNQVSLSFALPDLPPARLRHAPAALPEAVGVPSVMGGNGPITCHFHPCQRLHRQLLSSVCTSRKLTNKYAGTQRHQLLRQ